MITILVLFWVATQCPIYDAISVENRWCIRHWNLHVSSNICPVRGFPSTCISTWTRQEWLQFGNKQELLPSVWKWKEILAATCFFKVETITVFSLSEKIVCILTRCVFLQSGRWLFICHVSGEPRSRATLLVPSSQPFSQRVHSLYNGFI